MKHSPWLLLFGLWWATPAMGQGTDASPAADAGAPTDAGASTDADAPTDAPTDAGSPTEAATPGCPEGNLLAGRKPIDTTDVRSAERLTDGKIRKDGTTWNGPRSAILADGDASVTWDLGRPTRLSAMMVQADNNDTFVVEGSLDGETWSPLWTIPRHPTAGLQTRLTQGLDDTARYVRLGTAQGDGFFGVGELMAFCAQPALWPPPIEAEAAPAKGKSGTSDRKVRMARNKIAVAVLGGVALLALLGMGRGWPKPWLAVVGGGLGALGWAVTATVAEKGFDSKWTWFALLAAALALGWLARCAVRGRRGEPWQRAVERGVLVAVIFAGGMSWINYGTFHGTRAIHYWDTFHYYMGGKYFAENGYELLYHCSAIAEVDDGRRKEFDERQIRDLRDNTLGDAVPHLERVQVCRDAFGPERWAAYQQDLRLFRSYMGSSWWAKMFKDHGFNASPVWIMVGRPITNIGWDAHLPPAELVNAPGNFSGKSRSARADIRTRFSLDRARFAEHIERYALLDGALYAGIFLLIGWAFGLRACALAVIIWGSGYPWAYFWTGGGFGRVPWLFMATAGMCLMGKGYKALGGAGITWAMLLRVFPGALIGGIAAKIGWNLVRHRTITPGHRRVILGCTLGLVVLVGASLPVVGGFDAYRSFLGNSFKHKSTPLTNHMGLPTLLSFKWEYRARKTRDNSKDDPFIVWKQKRQETLESRRWLHAACLLAFLGLLGYVGRRLDDWALVALSTVMIVGVFELTCYYYNFVVLLAPFALRRWRYAAALLVMTVWGQVLQLQVGWYDVQYTYETAVVLGAMLFILGDVAWRHRQLDRAGVTEDPDADPPRDVLAQAARIEAARAAAAPDGAA